MQTFRPNKPRIPSLITLRVDCFTILGYSDCNRVPPSIRLVCFDVRSRNAFLMKSGNEIYCFRPAGSDDLNLMRHWRQAPHVVEWWGAPELEPEEEKMQDSHISMRIIEHLGEPFAFIQDYSIHDWEDHHFSYLPRGSRGLDIYIGENSMLNRGHGSVILGIHAANLFARSVPAVGIDPSPENLAAIRSFGKAGFSITSQPVSTLWGTAILMESWPPNRTVQVGDPKLDHLPS